MARMDKDSGRASNNQEAAVVDQLIKKLRPFDKSFVSERASAVGARPLSRLRVASPPDSPLQPQRQIFEDWRRSVSSYGVVVGHGLTV